MVFLTFCKMTAVAIFPSAIFQHEAVNRENPMVAPKKIMNNDIFVRSEHSTNVKLKRAMERRKNPAHTVNYPASNCCSVF